MLKALKTFLVSLSQEKVSITLTFKPSSGKAFEDILWQELAKITQTILLKPKAEWFKKNSFKGLRKKCNEDYIHAQESLKYLLSDHLQKKFAGLWSEASSLPNQLCIQII